MEGKVYIATKDHLFEDGAVRIQVSKGDYVALKETETFFNAGKARKIKVDEGILTILIKEKVVKLGAAPVEKPAEALEGEGS